MTDTMRMFKLRSGANRALVSGVIGATSRQTEGVSRLYRERVVSVPRSLADVEGHGGRGADQGRRYHPIWGYVGWQVGYRLADRRQSGRQVGCRLAVRPTARVRGRAGGGHPVRVGGGARGGKGG